VADMKNNKSNGTLTFMSSSTHTAAGLVADLRVRGKWVNFLYRALSCSMVIASQTIRINDRASTYTPIYIFIAATDRFIRRHLFSRSQSRKVMPLQSVIQTLFSSLVLLHKTLKRAVSINFIRRQPAPRRLNISIAVYISWRFMFLIAFSRTNSITLKPVFESSATPALF